MLVIIVAADAGTILTPVETILGCGITRVNMSKLVITHHRQFTHTFPDIQSTLITAKFMVDIETQCKIIFSVEIFLLVLFPFILR